MEDKVKLHQEAEDLKRISMLSKLSPFVLN
jgi:hypothetical protein